jgi:hypothetical protein
VLQSDHFVEDGCLHLNANISYASFDDEHLIQQRCDNINVYHKELKEKYQLLERKGFFRHFSFLHFLTLFLLLLYFRGKTYELF